MEKKINNLLAEVVLRTAANTENKASLWGCYQPHEPKESLVKIKRARKF